MDLKSVEKQAKRLFATNKNLQDVALKISLLVDAYACMHVSPTKEMLEAKIKYVPEYELMWKRFIATHQCAEYEQRAVTVNMLDCLDEMHALIELMDTDEVARLGVLCPRFKTTLSGFSSTFLQNQFRVLEGIKKFKSEVIWLSSWGDKDKYRIIPKLGWIIEEIASSEKRYE